MKRLSLLLACLAPLACAAGCPQPAYTPAAQLRPGGDALLIVTHASSNDDARFATKIGVDDAVAFAREHRAQVVYLQDGRPPTNYFMEDCRPDHWVYSEDGEVGFEVPQSHLYVAGGHLEECLSRTLNDVIYQWARGPRRSRSVTFFMDAIFSNGKRFEESDPYYRDYQRFMAIVTWGRPAGEHYPKLTLLESMGVIRDEMLQYLYLERVLPRYDRTFSAEYRVEMRMNDSIVRVLQRGRGIRPPVLRFNFVDSASDRFAPNDL